MILLAYGCLVAALAGFLMRRRAFRLSRRSELLARLFGMIGAAATASVAVLVLVVADPPIFGRVILFSLLLGSVLYLCGLALWHERAGFALRLSGWILAVAALAVPSTLTLLLPLGCALALALRSAPENR
jgi:uncharacterized membrane protein